MKKQLFTFFMSCFFGLSAQETIEPFKDKTKNTQITEKRTHAVFVEFWGSGLIYSINYDVRLLKSNFGPGIRIGAGGFAVGGSSFYTIPIGFNYLIGKEMHAFEMGAGGTLTNIARTLNIGTNSVVGNLTLAYRLQPKNGFSFRLGFMQIFGSEKGSFYTTPWGGVSFGYSF